MFLALVLATLIGCASADPFPGVPVLDREDLIVTIQADPVPCTGAHGPQTCLVMALPDGSKTRLYDGIFGYAHVPGAQARLRVQKVTLDGSDHALIPQDAGTIYYQLLETL